MLDPLRSSFLASVAFLLVLSGGCSEESRGKGSPTDLSLSTSDLSTPPDFAGLDLLPPSCKPCQVTGPGDFCGLTIGITPFVQCMSSICSGPAFQSDVGTGQSHTITITISNPINWVSVDILDSDFPGNKLRCYDAMNNQIGADVDFPADGTPGVLTNTNMGAGGNGIVKVVLEPASGDYVAYGNLQVVPSGCGVPVL